jgi:colicin import membrane protein
LAAEARARQTRAAEGKAEREARSVATTKELERVKVRAAALGAAREKFDTANGASPRDADTVNAALKWLGRVCAAYKASAMMRAAVSRREDAAKRARGVDAAVCKAEATARAAEKEAAKPDASATAPEEHGKATECAAAPASATEVLDAANGAAPQDADAADAPLRLLERVCAACTTRLTSCALPRRVKYSAGTWHLLWAHTLSAACIRGAA